jgi:hypothetical protein
VRAGRMTIAPCLLLAALLAGCSPSDEEDAYLARRALLLRQNQGIREMIVDAEKGQLIQDEEFLVGIDETVVADVVRAGLPIERPLGKHFRVRLETATVRFRDKYGTIDVEGVLFRPSTPDRKTAVRVHGGLGQVKIDPQTGKLVIKIAVDDIELLQAGILDRILGAGGKKFVALRGRELLQDALPDIEIPVALAQDIRIPAVRAGAVQMDSLRIPIDLSVKRVLAARTRLWVAFDAKVGTIEGAEGGVGVRVGKKKGRKA